jgi:hypothetical protein
MATDKASAFERNQIIPDFTLQNVAGETVSSRSYYMHRNYVLALLTDTIDEEWMDWISRLRSTVESIPAADGEVVCLVVAQPGSEAVLEQIGLTNRFQILIDEKSIAEERFKHDLEQGTLLVTDRYGVVFHSASGEPSSPEMSPEDVPSWIELIACRCS